MPEQTYATAARPALAATPPGAAPADVTRLAGERGLGELLELVQPPNPFARAVRLGGGGIATVVGTIVLATLVGSFLPRFLLIALVIPALAFGIVLIMLGATALKAGFQAFYVHTHGVVHRRNRRLRATRWSELTGVSVIRMASGAIVGLQLEPAGAEPAIIPTVGEDEGLPDRVLELAERAGCPVHRGPRAGV